MALRLAKNDLLRTGRPSEKECLEARGLRKERLLQITKPFTRGNRPQEIGTKRSQHMKWASKQDGARRHTKREGGEREIERERGIR